MQAAVRARRAFSCIRIALSVARLACASGAAEGSPPAHRALLGACPPARPPPPAINASTAALWQPKGEEIAVQEAFPHAYRLLLLPAAFCNLLIPSGPADSNSTEKAELTASYDPQQPKPTEKSENASAAALWQQKGEEIAVQAAFAPACPLLLLPAASCNFGIPSGPCLTQADSNSTEKAELTNSHDPEHPKPTEKSEVKYFTAWSQCGVPITADISNCRTLGDLFTCKRELCFYNYNSRTGKNCFSDLATDIFKLLATVSYRHAADGNKRFHFDPTTIIVKCVGNIVLDVLVPENQIGEENNDNSKSIYVDNVVGPLACLIFSLHLHWTSCSNNTDDSTYKEILDLLELSMKKRWWTTLEDILDHALFWKIEKRLAAVTCSYMWMHPPKSHIWHGIRGFKPKKRKIKASRFVQMFSKNFFYLKKFTVTKTSLNEYHVTSKREYKDWKQEYIAAGSFAHDYENFGNGQGSQEAADAEEFMRHIMTHFGDNNFAVLKSQLHRPTLKSGLIELERTFYVGLTVYHVLRQMNLGTDVLDVEF